MILGNQPPLEGIPEEHCNHKEAVYDHLLSNEPSFWFYESQNGGSNFGYSLDSRAEKDSVVGLVNVGM